MKFLLLGIDAFDPKIVENLKSELPNLSGLQHYSRLETTIPPETPVAWSSAATGANPGRFGIYDFMSK